MVPYVSRPYSQWALVSWDLRWLWMSWTGPLLMTLCLWPNSNMASSSLRLHHYLSPVPRKYLRLDISLCSLRGNSSNHLKLLPGPQEDHLFEIKNLKRRKLTQGESAHFCFPDLEEGQGTALVAPCFSLRHYTFWPGLFFSITLCWQNLLPSVWAELSSGYTSFPCYLQ